MNRLILIFVSFISISVQAQVMTKTALYSIASPYLETTQQILSVPVGDMHFVSLNKIKGTQLGSSSFLLEKYDIELNIKFSTPLEVAVTEDYKELHVVGSELFLFSELHDVMRKTKALKLYVFNIETGVLLKDNVLHEQAVAPWMVYTAKGMTKETFELAISSNLTYNFNTPLEYQYTIQFSPDKKSFLVYTFDYSQKTLIASTIVLDAALEVLKKGNVSVDNNFINYGIYINNKQELHILNCDRNGRIVLVRFDLTSRDMIFLDIQSSISKRESLKLLFLNDNEVYVANTVIADRKFIGVMYSKFNFEKRIVEKLNIHDMSDGMKQTALAIHNATKMFSSEENWLNYQITDFYLNQYEKLVIVVEKKDLEIIGYNYESSSVNDVKNWMIKTGKVHAESVMLFSFNKNDDLLWENYYSKNQVNDINAGITSASYSMHISEEGKVRMVYASSDNAAGVYNQLKYVEWDEVNGSKVKDLTLANEEGLSFLRNYTLWWEGKLFLVGKKGMLGKKTSANIYNLSSK